VPIPRLTDRTCVLIVVDLQERLVPAMHEPAALVARAEVLLRGAAELGVPTLLTRQAPDKLGDTVAPLRGLVEPAAPVQDKLAFSAAVPGITEALRRLGRPAVVVAGIEAHVCVMQSCLDLAERGYVTAVVRDAVGSRDPREKAAGLARMEQAGVIPTTAESLLLEWVGTAEHPGFRAVQRLIR